MTQGQSVAPINKAYFIYVYDSVVNTNSNLAIVIEII